MHMLFAFTKLWICSSVSLQSADISRLDSIYVLLAVYRLKGVTFFDYAGQSTFRMLIGLPINSAKRFCSAFIVTGFRVCSYSNKTSTRVSGTLMD